MTTFIHNLSPCQSELPRRKSFLATAIDARLSIRFHWCEKVVKSLEADYRVKVCRSWCVAHLWFQVIGSSGCSGMCAWTAVPRKNHAHAVLLDGFWGSETGWHWWQWLVFGLWLMSTKSYGVWAIMSAVMSRFWTSCWTCHDSVTDDISKFRSSCQEDLEHFWCHAAMLLNNLCGTSYLKVVY